NTNAIGVHMPALCAVNSENMKSKHTDIEHIQPPTCSSVLIVKKTYYLPLESKPLLMPTERTSVNNSPTQTFRNIIPLYDKYLTNPQYGVAESDEHNHVYTSRNTGATGVHMATNTINKQNIIVDVKNVSTNNSKCKSKVHTIGLNTINAHTTNVNTINATTLENCKSVEEQLHQRRFNLLPINHNIGTQHSPVEKHATHDSRKLLANNTRSISKHALDRSCDKTVTTFGLHVVECYMETVTVEESGRGEVESVTDILISKQIADPVVYKLARATDVITHHRCYQSYSLVEHLRNVILRIVEGDGRLVPATDDEVMEAEFFDGNSSVHHVLDTGETGVCTMDDDAFDEGFMSIDCEGLLNFDDPSTQEGRSDAVVDTTVDLAKLNPQFEIFVELEDLLEQHFSEQSNSLFPRVLYAHER
ncbi:hypothetical protein Tco_0658350, partial [Tanacetum coccineum]